MGENTVENTWRRSVEEVINEFSKLFSVEAVIVFGSWVRSGGGEWSDVDVLIVGDVSHLSPLERFKLVVEHKPPRTDVFLYTYEELKNMLKRGNPLAISALVEGISVKISKRVEELAKQAKRHYVRRGRVWIDKRYETH